MLKSSTEFNEAVSTTGLSFSASLSSSHHLKARGLQHPEETCAGLETKPRPRFSVEISSSDASSDVFLDSGNLEC
jgi:hypothetical protein